MKTLILGCVYTGLKNIEKALQSVAREPIEILNAKDISAVSPSGVFFGSRWCARESVSYTFLRYPYDLIAPHSATYSLREETEYYKSICLLFDAKNINPLATTWALRNRLYSLTNLAQRGAHIANFRIRRSDDPFEVEEASVVKAIGNCFVSENTDVIQHQEASFYSIEQDGKDRAAVFPAALLSPNEIRKHGLTVNHLFLQNHISAEIEFRCYLIGDRFFIFRRSEIDRFDKSFADYESTEYKLSHRTCYAVKLLSEDLRLKYCCFDLISNANGQEFIIDFNPYGSLPKYDKFPQPSEAVAEVMLDSKK